MEKKKWEHPFLNYWENPDCPRGYLESAFDILVEKVEGVRVSREHVKSMSEKELRERVGFYEYVSDK